MPLFFGSFSPRPLAFENMGNKRHEVESQARPEPAVRIRHLLLLGLGFSVLWGLYPRARAAWALHDRATAMANYAACMVGPTGPLLFRDAPDQFVAMVRRRLITASPESHPFQACASLARTASASSTVERAHMAEAQAYAEYGKPGQLSTTGLDAMRFSASLLAPLAEQAWPFERAGYSRLLRASTHAKEAHHPVPIAAPLSGSGIPGWRALFRSSWHVDGRWLMAFGHSSNMGVVESLDGGLHWRPVSLNQPGIAEHGGRCIGGSSAARPKGAMRNTISSARGMEDNAPARRAAFTVSGAGSGVVVNSLLGDVVTHQVQLRGVDRILSLSCDGAVAVLAVSDADRRSSLLSCRHNGACVGVPTPDAWLAAHFDVAHIAGATVVAVVENGIVRVRSTRDGGSSWTPATVAFDWASQAPTTDIKVPSRLLTLGRRLLLYGAAGPGQSYPVVISDDQGASWRTPQAAATEAMLGAASN